MSIGEKLKNLRLMRKKTLREQSEVFGVSLNSVYRWEHDLTIPKRSILKKMAEYYEVPLVWLLQDGGDEEKFSNGDAYSQYESGDEVKLLKMYRSLSDNHKYKILGYVERIYVEALDEKNEVLENGEKE